MDMNGNFLRAYRGSTLTADEILRQADASSKYAAPTAPTALSPARSTRTAATVSAGSSPRTARQRALRRRSAT
jgi:hypothetical protein